MVGTIWKNMIPGQHVPGEYDYVKIFSGTSYAISLLTEQYNDVVEAYGCIQKIISIIAICIVVLTCCFTIPMKSLVLKLIMKSKTMILQNQIKPLISRRSSLLMLKMLI